MKYLIVFYKFLAKYKWRMVIFLTVVTMAMILESIRPYFLKMILDAAGISDMAKVWTAFLLLGVTTVVGNWISAWSFYLGDRSMIPLTRDIREAVFQKVLELDFAYHVDKSTGSMISIFKRGDQAVFNIFFNIHNELFRVLISLVVTLYFLATASLQMALILVILFGINLGIIIWLIKINLKTRTEFNSAEDEVSGVITDSLINYETVKFFAAEIRERKNLNLKFIHWTKSFWRFTNSFRLMEICIGTVSAVGILLILGIAIAKLNHGFSVGDLVMVSGFLTAFYSQFFNLFFRIRDIAKSMTDLEKYLAVLDNSIVVSDPEVETQPVNIEGKIEYQNVSFSYPKDRKQTVEDVDLVINPREKVAFVGKSGAGKTTLIKLLLRFYDPNQGQILLDGVDIRRMKKSFLRSLLGIVPQEPIMFNNTLKFNLAYGKANASLEEIRQAAKTAQILDFIEQLPEAWETQVGERGIKLSGGQKQRLAIARALLANPKVLIFDEATSNLDSESETKIQAALKIVSHDRTVIIIAHRFSTIRHVDKIVVLADGRIDGIGQHADLVEKNGIYKKLWTLQAEGKLV